MIIISYYTISLKNICEMLGKSESIQENLMAGKDYIFNFNYPVYSLDYKNEFETKFMKNFYMREIGQETIELFIFYLDEKLNKIMPYYNKLIELYKSDYDNFTTENIISDLENTGVINSNGISNANSKNLYSDTPQGSIKHAEDEKYLTNVTLNENNNNDTNLTNSSNKNKGVIKGYRDISPFEIIKKYSTNMVNIETMIFDELDELFMGVY